MSRRLQLLQCCRRRKNVVDEDYGTRLEEEDEVAKEGPPLKDSTVRLVRPL